MLAIRAESVRGVLDGTCGVLESVNAVVDSAISYRACECVFPAK